MRRIFWLTGSAVVLFFYLFISIGSPSTKSEVMADYRLNVPLGMDEDFFIIPKDNLLNTEKIGLGRALFFDTRLSEDNTIACATCHDPKLAFTDGQPVSKGMDILKGSRNAPTIINKAFNETLFWDGRTSSLEEQVKEAIINPLEIGMPDHSKVVQKLNNIEGYRKWFRKVFGTDVTLDGIAKAIAAFERTVMSGNSPVDRYNYEGEESALSESAKRGMEIFKGKADCIQCHAGFNFTDELFHNVGVDWDSSQIDLGRFAVTKKKRGGVTSIVAELIESGVLNVKELSQVEDIGRFRTPPLREIANTAPYMHNGSLATLREVIDFYNNGGIENPFLDKKIKKLNLTEQEKDDLIEFLKSLSGEGWQHITPPLLSLGVFRSEEDPLSVGKNLYDRFCAQCHGEKGRGDGVDAEYLDPLPVDLTDSRKKYMAKLTNEEIIEVISKGGTKINKSPKMPPFGMTLSEYEIGVLTAYVRTLHPNNAGPIDLSALNKERPKTNFTEVEIDPAKSKRFFSIGRRYYKKKGCGGCHSLGGEGGKSGPELNGISFRMKPQDIFKTIKDPRMVKEDTAMPNFGLSDDAAIYITQYLLSL